MEFVKELLEKQQTTLGEEIQYLNKDTDKLEYEETKQRLEEVNNALLILFGVNRSLPTEKEIDIVANTKTLKYYYANEYGYTKGKRLFIEGVNWLKNKQI